AISAPSLGKMLQPSIIETKPEVDMLLAIMQEIGLKEAEMVAPLTLKCAGAQQFCSVHPALDPQCCPGTKCVHYNNSWGLCLKI
ncbi:hypothetical protein, partial [Dorea formicigenerans]|uniref:hypothetical protein n=1 Tax=Dorea formicigenerans TaxID=39486 RepID=UPI001C017EE1